MMLDPQLLQAPALAGDGLDPARSKRNRTDRARR
jgi:hypothetical protein